MNDEFSCFPYLHKQITVNVYETSFTVPDRNNATAICLIFQVRSDSMASVYSGAGEGRYGTVAVRGQVEFGLQYNYKAGALEIHVKQVGKFARITLAVDLFNCFIFFYWFKLSVFHYYLMHRKFFFHLFR